LIKTLDCDIDGLFLTPGEYKTKFGITTIDDYEFHVWQIKNGVNRIYTYDCSELFKYFDKMPVGLYFSFTVHKYTYATSSYSAEMLFPPGIKRLNDTTDTPTAYMQRLCTALAGTGYCNSVTFDTTTKLLTLDMLDTGVIRYDNIDAMAFYMSVDQATESYVLIIEKK
jgi:hypothetical protein